MHPVGEPIHGELHSADAHLGVEIPIRNSGTLTVRTLAANEYIEITELSLVTVAGGDCYVMLSVDTSLDAGETAVRGTFGANGGIAPTVFRFAGKAGAKPYLVAPAGVVDVVFDGFIRRSGTTGARESWREKVQA